MYPFPATSCLIYTHLMELNSARAFAVDRESRIESKKDLNYTEKLEGDGTNRAQL